MKKSRKYFQNRGTEFKKSSTHNFGYDRLTICTGYSYYAGCILNSPSTKIIESKYGISFKHETEKTFRANWMIDNSRLILGSTYGYVNEITVYPNDIMSDYNHYEVCNHYKDVTGDLIFSVEDFCSYHEDYWIVFELSHVFRLTFKNGILVNTVLKLNYEN